MLPCMACAAPTTNHNLKRHAVPCQVVATAVTTAAAEKDEDASSLLTLAPETWQWPDGSHLSNRALACDREKQHVRGQFGDIDELSRARQRLLWQQSSIKTTSANEHFVGVCLLLRQVSGTLSVQVLI
eukprot:TRINITY_DN114942_c0_g1_i1.p1 TRINITY_DN114942_c0_g1~~TRINITY_DN114942_c0_g1_i1.p1  ORF type:complete len:128 (-),score=11.74 TRINITY_DN114942_c0_g1_i1:14-397(-)